ncbi:MAG: TSUP family transporter [Betaproteobacteria bacterium]|nr:TSUP family transporter [Betaproteobacteria bacterium]MBK8688825.1 TSUP family transporter [Betaproteobacteria bacterium]
MELLLLGVLALFAGFVDAIVGGGGLVQLPALFGAYPGASPALLLGTNKMAGIAGTAVAATRYLRRVRLPWAVLGPAVVGALLFALLGARAVAWLPREAVRPLILVLLIVVAVYTFLRKDFGAVHAPRRSAAAAPWLGFATGATLGFYDGFFGPGTGAFLMFVFVRLFGWDLLMASAAARVVNVATNFTALAFFAATGNVLWLTGLVMASCNIAGSIAGSGLALARGTAFVRGVFLVVLAVLIAKFGWDTLAAWW